MPPKVLGDEEDEQLVTYEKGLVQGCYNRHPAREETYSLKLPLSVLETLTMRIPERLRLGPNLTPRASPIVIPSLEDLAWHVLASAAAPSLGQTEGHQKRKCKSTVK